MALGRLRCGKGRYGSGNGFGGNGSSNGLGDALPSDAVTTSNLPPMRWGHTTSPPDAVGTYDMPFQCCGALRHAPPMLSGIAICASDAAGPPDFPFRRRGAL
jgi:hypothetical protein